MSIRNLNQLFQPQSVAVIGASPKKSSIGNVVLTNLLDKRFPGKVYPVNPNHAQVEGLACYQSVLSIQSPIDLAIISTPASTIPAIVDECGQAGVATIIVVSAGFKETGSAGAQLEDEVSAIQRKYPGMRVVGPNCLGILSPYHGLNASFAKSLPKPGRIAFISQSGALCTSILDWAIDEGIGFSAVASIGNSLDVDLGDLIDYLALDPNTDSVVLYVESIRNARKFMSAAREFTRTKPIIAYKAGRFAVSAKAASSHTGAMVGEDCVYDAAFARAGIVRVNDMNELFSSAEVLARSTLPRGNRLAIVSNAGGPGIMATDAVLSRNGVLAALSDSTVQTLSLQLPKSWSHSNPVDILGDAPPSRYGQAIETVLQDNGVDGLIVLLTPQAMTQPTETAAAVIAAKAKSTKPVLAVWMGGSSVQEGIQLLNQAAIPTFRSPEQAVIAFDNMVQYGQRREILYETPHETAIDYTKDRMQRDAMVKDRTGLLDEIDSKSLLNAYGIPTNETLFASSAAEAVAIANQLDCPVALKILSPDISHKTNVGGVVLNVCDDTEVVAAFEHIMNSAKKAEPNARLTGVSVQPMVTDANSIELIVGVKRDPTFGSVLMLGSGGTMAELIQDKVVALPPLNDRLALRMLMEMKAWTLLNGYRGRPAANIEQLVNILIKLSYLVAERPEVLELDINPLVVTPTSVIAVDARVVLDSTEPNANDPGNKSLPYEHLAIRPCPIELKQSVSLNNGQPVTIRSMRPDDEPMWIELLESCSQATIHERFGGLIHTFDHQFATRFCFHDYDREVALVAELDTDGTKQLIGVGRLVTYADRTKASISLLVSDHWQWHGLGAILTDTCLNVAKDWNIKTIVAETTAENFRAREIFRNREFHEKVGDDGIVIASRQLQPDA